MRTYLKKKVMCIVLFVAATNVMAQNPWSGTTLTDPTTRTGNVGIGPVTPTGLLHLSYSNATNTTRQKLQHWEWVSNSNFQLDVFGDGHTSRPGVVQFGGWNNDVTLGFVVDSKSNVESGTSNKGLFIRSAGSGLVGIGTTTPSAYLHVVTSTATNTLLQNTNTGAGSAVGIDFLPGGSTSTVAKARIEAVDASAGHSALTFQTSNAGATPTERMRITQDGRLALGITDAEGFKLRVQSVNEGGLKVVHNSSTDWGFALNVTVNRDVTKAFTVTNSVNNADNFVIWGNGVVNAKKIWAESFTVQANAIGISWPDYVFEKSYSLRSLGEVESFVNKHKHLPEVPSAAEITVNGLNTAEMDMALLKKVEELTLYVIELNKQNELLKKQLELQRHELNTIQTILRK